MCLEVEALVGAGLNRHPNKGIVLADGLDRETLLLFLAASQQDIHIVSCVSFFAFFVL